MNDDMKETLAIIRCINLQLFQQENIVYLLSLIILLVLSRDCLVSLMCFLYIWRLIRKNFYLLIVNCVFCVIVIKVKNYGQYKSVGTSGKDKSSLFWEKVCLKYPRLSVRGGKRQLMSYLKVTMKSKNSLYYVPHTLL